MSLERLGKNVLLSLILLGLVAAIDQAQFPFAKQLGTYIDYVLNTTFDLDPLTDLTQRLQFLPDWLTQIP